jgi:hypothetical protein
MSTKFFDVIVAKEYETRNNGQVEKKTAWNRIGRAWPSRSGESLSFELYLLPNQRYVIQLQDRKPEQSQSTETAQF